MSQHGVSASSLISGLIKAVGERSKAEEMNAVMDDDSMILSDSEAIEYAQPYNKYYPVYFAHLPFLTSHSVSPTSLFPPTLLFFLYNLPTADMV
jgi:hypothetical protein